jgi:hypothetical protein
MNWYKRIKLAQFGAGYGEWWIGEDGNAMFADGDISDMNHEGYVMQTARALIAKPEYNQGEWTDWTGFVYDKSVEILEKSKSNPQLVQELEQRLNKSFQLIKPQDIVYEGMVEEELLKEGFSQEEISAAEGRGDLRLFAIKNWGWKRVMNNQIETYTLTDNDLNVISKGLSDIVQNDEEGNSLWNIESINPRQYLQNIPLKYIDMGMQGIQAYTENINQTKQSPMTMQQWKNRTSD